MNGTLDPESPDERRRQQNRKAQKRKRERVKDGLDRYVLLLNTNFIAERLIEAGRLTPKAALDREQVEHALEYLITEALTPNQR